MLKKQIFTIEQDDLTKAIDVDDSLGRSVPVNMNFIEEGYLIKDTGYIPLGLVTDELAHSFFNYKKKNGDSYFIRVKGTKLQQYSLIYRDWVDINNSPTFTAGAKFGYIVYNDYLYFGNAVEALYKWDGTTFTAYASAPKGNILEIFEDRLFIAGVTAEPLTAYYSNIKIPSTFTGTDVLKPLGTDHITGLVNYFGSLLLFKKESIWKMTFIYDQVVSLFVPKLEAQNRNYGACSRQAIAWVENDVWFFNGREVRSIGFKDQQIGVLGVNNTVISDSIKQTLDTVKTTNYENVVVFYHNRRFYLGVILGDDTVSTLFVCHLLYQNNWTKYTNRDKAKLGGAVVINGIIYTYNDFSPYGVIKWTVEEGDELSVNAYLTTE